MTKLFVALLVVSLLAFVSASDDDDDFDSLFSKSMFDDMLKPLENPLPFGADDVKNMKPPKGGKSESHFSSKSNVEEMVDGKKVKDETKKDAVDNVNGVVTEEHTVN